jgi:hypothetical protein
MLRMSDKLPRDGYDTILTWMGVALAAVIAVILIIVALTGVAHAKRHVRSGFFVAYQCRATDRAAEAMSNTAAINIMS